LKSPFAQGSEATLIIATTVLALLAWVNKRLPQPCGAILLLLLAPLWVLVLYFFRDPDRRIPAGENLVLSPADGKVMDICEVHEPLFIQGPAVRVSIFMSITDVHVNRAPAAGEVVLVKQIAGILARRCVNYAAVGDQLETGQRFGLISFRSRVDLFLPPKIQPVVQLGEQVQAGSSVLAQWTIEDKNR